ncbi:MAG TPA: DUF2277 domain-containing protein [Acidimicrobiales bacterium]|nr:DUF2277 domain-containing protein [Acidimicrobiales bacterium]
MCRSITTLRGLEPAATPEEVEAAARQFVRKLSGIRHPSAATQEPFDRAVADIAAAAVRMLEELPPRKQPPTTVPPNRRGHPI